MHKVPSLSKKTIRSIALTVVVILVSAVVFFPRLSNAGATVAAALLLLVTLEYVLTNQESVELFRKQIEHQRGVFLDFGVVAENREPVLWIANLGIATFIVKGVIVGMRDKEYPWPTHLLVPAGRIEKLVFPEVIWKSASIRLDIQVSLRYSGIAEEGTTKPKVFSLGISLNDFIYDVRDGLDWPWTVQCPKCSKWVANMRVDELNSFAEAEQRKSVMEKDFSETCPTHRSQWIWIRKAAE